MSELIEEQSNEESVINELIKDDYEQYAYYINSIYGKRDSNLPQVKSPEIFLKGDKNEKFHPEGLFSEQIFGPLSNYTCQCNITRYNAETVRCQKCGVKYSESTRSDQFGIIKLPFRIMGPQIFHLMLKYNPKYQTRLDRFETEVIDEMFELLDALYFYNPDGTETLIPREGEITNSAELPFIDKLNNQEKDVLLTPKLMGLKNMVKNNPYLLFKFNVAVMPPDLRPITGGKLNFITDEMNHYYQKILEHIHQLGQEEIKKFGYHRLIITKIIYQSYIVECVDKIPSKQGYFRQKIYGKRVDFSARTVATIDCSLNMNQVKIPYEILAKIYSPFIFYSHPIGTMAAYNDVKNYIDNGILSAELKSTIDIIAKRIPVSLNRQPTLHRPSLRAFEVIPSEGKTIRVNPFIVEGFNLDFDGDQMAVYAPVFEEEIYDMQHKLINHKNQIQPGTLKFASVHQFGYSTFMITKKSVSADETPAKHFILNQPLNSFENITMIELAHKEYLQSLYDNHKTMKKKILNSYWLPISYSFEGDSEKRVTTIGRLIISLYLNTIVNEVINKRKFNEIVSNRLLNLMYEIGHKDFTYSHMKFLDTLLHKHLIQIPITVSLRDFTDIYKNEDYRDSVNKLISSRTSKDAKTYADEVEKIIKDNVDATGNLTDFIMSGAKGSFSSIKQLLGAKGTVMSPQGAMVPYFIKRNFTLGLSEKDMYIMSFGSRKGSLDRSVNTADTGYLTRKLIFALQEGEHDSTIDDCGTDRYLTVKLTEDLFNAYMFKNISLFEDFGKYKSTDVITLIPDNIKSFKDLEVKLWTQIHCKSKHYCKKCYGDYHKIFDSRYVGVIAAQVLGERCTQLTMRTFHTGGVAEDIRDFINKEFMRIEDDKIIANKKIILESVETENSLSDLAMDYELEFDLYLMEKEKEAELQLPKGCVLNMTIENKTIIPVNAVIARIPSSKTSSITSVVDYIMKVIEKPEDGYRFESLYQLLLDAFYHTEGIISSHIETVIAQMMRNPNDITKFSRTSETPDLYKLVSIKEIPALRRLLGIGFQYFHKNLLVNMTQGYADKIEDDDLTIMEKVISGVSLQNLGLTKQEIEG